MAKTPLGAVNPLIEEEITVVAEGTIEEVLRQSQQPTLDDAFLRYTTP